MTHQEPDPGAGPLIDRGIRLISALSVGIGPRPPCSAREEEASALICDQLERLGLSPKVDGFASARSFGPSYLVIFGMALLSWSVERRRRCLSAGLGAGAAVLGIAESRFSSMSPLALLRRRTSQNVSATIEPKGSVERTVCLVSHMDSSRSGLMFHPKVTPHLGLAVSAVGVAVAFQALAPLLRLLPAGRASLLASRLLVAAGAGLVAQREVVGSDVPGANDNASGVAACLALAARFTELPLESTRLVVLVTGSEESGVFGMRKFLASNDTSEWSFVNFDGVGADAPLRVLSSEGGPLSGLKADPGLLTAAEAVGREFPELRAEPLANGSGLPYDATPVMQAGGRAISIVNQEGAIPNYHWPSDTADRISPSAFRRAVEFGGRLVERIDRGGADGQP